MLDHQGHESQCIERGKSHRNQHMEDAIKSYLGVISLNISETDSVSLLNLWWPIISFLEYQVFSQHWRFQRETWCADTN